MDKTQINLERIRACDAGWEENKHPRADNGQFTSGSGGGVQALKNVTKAVSSPGKGPGGGDAQQSAARFREVAKGIGNADSIYKKYALNLAKAAEAGGEAGAMKRAEKIKASINADNSLQDIEKKMRLARLNAVMDQYNTDKSEQSAPKPQASHPMAGEVQKDLDYWLNTQHGGHPSEAQRQRAVESLKAQYESGLRSAEKNWNMAQKVKDLDEGTKNKYKQKYETAKGKLEAIGQMYK
jgi:hypothetical protein